MNNSKNSIYASEYGYDLNNNVSRFTSSAGGTSVTESFEYGTDNLATKYTYPSGKTATYTNDGLLRRNSTVINTDTPINHQFVYLMSARGGDAQTTKIGWEHINNYIYAYTYDASGNPTSYKGATITWNGRLMTSYEKDDERYEYTYNSDGMRTSKKRYSDGELAYVMTYVWDGDVLLANRLFNPESNDSVIISYLYDADGELFGMEYNGNGVFAYTKNLQGDIVGIIPLDNESTADVGIEYDAWGYPHYRQGSSIAEGFLIAVMAMINAVGYRGYFSDMDTRLYYLRSRYYDPETGRFINADDIEMMVPQKPSQLNVLLSTYYSLNAYAYCENNPVNKLDTSGKGSNVLVNSPSAFYLIYLIITILSAYQDNGALSVGSYDKLGHMKVNFKITVKTDSGDLPFYHFLDIFFSDEVYFKLVLACLTDFLFEMFLEKYKREFLFSGSCVLNEIYHHYIGYMWSIGKKGYKAPLYMIGYGLLTSNKDFKKAVREACKEADIYEKDVYANIKESIAYDYFNGINAEYLKTDKDPYYYKDQNKRKRIYNKKWNKTYFKIS